MSGAAEGTVLFRHAGADFMAQLMPLFLLGFGFPVLFFDRFIAAAAVGVCAIYTVGFRASIVVREGHVRVDKYWFFIRYRRYEGARLDLVRFSGDWGEIDSWGAVCVDIGEDDDISLGAPWNQRRLHRELSRFASMSLD